MKLRIVMLALLTGLAGSVGLRSEDKDASWEMLFNGKDTTGWKLRAEKINETKFLDSEGKVIAGAKKAKVDQKEVVRDAKNKPLAVLIVIKEIASRHSVWPRSSHPVPAKACRKHG